jgi:pimeloyl-ACP methyl ester carboxylesterase
MASTAAAPSPQSSTIVRTDSRLRLLQLALRAGTRVAPDATERWAASRFFVPRRPRPAPLPEAFGLERRAWTLALGRERLAAWSWGEGPAVLLAHGWEGHAGQLAPFVPALVAAGYRAVAFDMPAHGRSTGRRATALDFAAALRAVAEVTGPPAAVVAHSLGGAATVYALRQGLRTERVVLLAPGGEPLEFAWIMAHALGFRGAQAARVVEGIRAQIGGAWEDWSVPRVVRDFPHPMLLLHDPADRQVPYEHGRRIAEAWPAARLVPLPGLGHHRLLRDPPVVREVADFVAGERLAAAA